MKVIQIKDNKVVDIINLRSDATTETIKIIDEIPTFEAREGFYGVLMYDDVQDLYWEYIEIPVNTEMTLEEKAAAYDILVGANSS